MFKKTYFFYEDLLIYSFFCFSLCYVLYVIFITFVENTSVNAQPLSPPIFQKIAPDFKNKVFLCCFFTFAFFILVHIFVNFRLPLPTPWPRLVPFVVDFGPIFVRFWSFLRPTRPIKHTHTTIPQPHNTTCNLVWHRTAQPRNTTGNHTHKPTNRRLQKTWPGGMRARALNKNLNV